MLRLRISKPVKPITVTEFLSQDDSEQLDRLIAALQRPLAAATSPPALIVMSPDIRGNSAGFQQLAIVALRAAKGQAQSFEGQDWIRSGDPDCVLSGFQPDPSAHVELPSEISPKQRAFYQLIGYLFMIGIIGCIAVGALTIVLWIQKHI